ncbi:hypothetical protein QEG73_04790 [Chitinophagaceae bacterium 26-R-25]|nr:hypothetical protein [Chitinophagaceae bacterium 26-R-25]
MKHLSLATIFMFFLFGCSKSTSTTNTNVETNMLDKKTVTGGYPGICPSGIAIGSASFSGGKCHVHIDGTGTVLISLQYYGVSTYATENKQLPCDYTFSYSNGMLYNLRVAPPDGCSANPQNRSIAAPSTGGDGGVGCVPPVMYGTSDQTQLLTETTIPLKVGYPSITYQADCMVRYRVQGTSTWYYQRNQISSTWPLVVTGLESSTYYEIQVAAICGQNSSGTDILSDYSDSIVTNTLFW